MSEKYYWLKLPQNFFATHDGKILRHLGSEYTVFYFMLLTDTIDSEGVLRFSENTPYTAETLSAIFDYDEEFIADALSKYEKYGLIKAEDDGTLLMTRLNSMVGSETKDAERMRRSREKQKSNNVQSCSNNVQACYTEKEKEIEKDKEIDKESESAEVPDIDEIKKYCNEMNFTVDAKRFYDYYRTKEWKTGNEPIVNWKALLESWNTSNHLKQVRPDGVSQDSHGDNSFDIELAKARSRDHTRDFGTMKNPKRNRSG